MGLNIKKNCLIITIRNTQSQDLILSNSLNKIKVEKN